MKHQHNKLSGIQLGAFAALEVPMAAFLTPLVVYIPAFYAGEMGLGLSIVGTVFGLTKLWDIVTDPIAGALTERIGPERGRWRFWLLASLPFMLIGVYKVFLPPAAVDWVYFATWMIFLYVGWTLLTISHISWGVELSDDYHERARIASYRQVAALVGGMIVVFIPVISDQLVGGSEADRIRFVGYFVLLALPLLAFATCWSTPAKKSRIDLNHRRKWHDSFKILRHNRSLRALLVANMGVLLGVSAMSSVLLFYVESVLNLGTWATFALAPLLFSGIFFMPFLKRLVATTGKHMTFKRVLIFQICVQPLFLVLPPDSLPLTLFSFLFLGVINGVAIFLPQAMLADLKDEETGTGKARTGVYVALLQSTSKVSSALAVAVMFLVLPMTGFDPDPAVENDADALMGLRYMMVGLPVAFFGLALIGLRRYDVCQKYIHGGNGGD